MAQTLLGFELIFDGKESYINFDDFFTFLKKSISAEKDGVKELRRNNLLRDLKQTKCINGQICANVLSVLRYVFNHTDLLGSCRLLSNKILEKLCYKDSTTVQTILGFYKTFTESHVKTKILKYCHHEKFHIDESKIPSLFREYKVHFEDSDWCAICLFEIHFSQYEESCADLDEEIAKRYKLLGHLEKAVYIGGQLQKHSPKVIARRQHRKALSNIQVQVQIKGCQLHLPDKIECDIITYLQSFFQDGIDSVTVVDDNKSDTENVILVFMQVVDDYINADLNSIAERVFYIVQKKHCLSCKLIFLDSKTLNVYKNKNDIVTRFSLRDDFLSNKFTAVVISCQETDQVYFEDEKCEECFQNTNDDELCLSNFSLLKEWKTSVPLDVQLILETFINTRSVFYSSDKKAIMQSKLKRLYNIFDMLLNTNNKKYAGILQDANTDELMMHYRSINTVFSIAASAGATSSLNCADKRMRDKADPELCYYNTYLKRYPITYQSSSGLIEKNVRLRDCHIILMLDNLVRLRFKADPIPGENRSQQMCTLPVTFQGLPKDDSVTESWHDQDICDGTHNCPCKNRVHLKKDDISQLYTPIPSEENTLRKFRNLCNWGIASVWKRIQASELLTSLTWTKMAEHTNNDDEASNNLLLTMNDNLSTDGGEIVIPVSSMSRDILDTSYIRGDSNDKNENYAVSDILQHAYAVLDDAIPEQELYADMYSGNEDPDQDLYEILKDAFLEEEVVDPIFDDITLLEEEMHILEKSLQNMSLPNEESSLAFTEKVENQICTEQDIPLEKEPIPILFGLQKYQPPSLMCRHPPPFHGRDDDIVKLREILDEVITKLGKSETDPDRILVGVDNKIGKDLLSLIRNNKKYRQFLPEFPLLHLRKSKITNLFASYKSAGIIQLLMFMREENNNDWSKLITIEHIDVATRYIRRLSTSIHLAFLITFMMSLPENEVNSLMEELESKNIDHLLQIWDNKFCKFLKDSAVQNKTFAIHRDMMIHMDEICAIQLAERLGGKTGYELLLGTVKSSLPFTFLNGSSSYAPFCTLLILEHLQAGHFHQKLKETLFSTPIGNSTINFACDTKRELDHQGAVKSFRSGSTMSSISCRMSLIDSLDEVHEWGRTERNETIAKEKLDDLGWKFTNVDLKYIIHTTDMILRRGGISTVSSDAPLNVYPNKPEVLTPLMLDECTFDVGKYLIAKYVAKEGLITDVESPDINDYVGPPMLLRKAQKGAAVTIRRATVKATQEIKTDRQVKEEKRQTNVKKDAKQLDCLTSEMNTCQALVKPDCSKPKVMKSTGVQKALLNLLNSNNISTDNLIHLGVKEIPMELKSKVEFVTVEFAGVKFKSRSQSGLEYLKNVESSVLKKTCYMMPNVKRVVICEEKYSFTPDDLKAATREQRKRDTGISHLKRAESMINQFRFDKSAVVHTTEGKSLISTYLARNAEILRLPRSLIVDIDSEYIKQKENCACSAHDVCQCTEYSVPIRCIFEQQDKAPKITCLSQIKQTKGEAELAQIDWLFEESNISDDGAVASIVTSGDIDAVVAHLFVIARSWQRDINGSFRHPVYVLLQKPLKYDIYNITQILENLENIFPGQDIGIKVATILSLGGNDFIPKYYGLSHDTMLKQFFQNNTFLKNLVFVDILSNQYHVNTDIYILFIKSLYGPKNRSHLLSFEEVRRYSMQSKRKTSSAIDIDGLRNAQCWMPPEGALCNVAELINLYLSYLSTAGHSNAPLPNFLSAQCLRKAPSGEVEYNFGPESQASLKEIKDMCVITKSISKRKLECTPQKDVNYKKMLTSTPKK